jgi:Lectin C-type domain
MRILDVIAGTFAILAAQTARGDILSGPLTNSANGHIYYLLTTNTWTGAEAEAVSLGGHLVAINDANENHWVCTNFLMFAGAPRGLWIGLFQPPGSPEPAGGWIWSSGEPVTFTNWVTGEPNNNTARGPQNWAMIWPYTATNNAAPYRDEAWNDTWNLPDTATGAARNTYGLHGVVEIAQPPSGTPTNSLIHTAVEIAWPSQAGEYYQVQWSGEVAPVTWLDLSGLVRGNGATNSFYDSTRASQKRFYRVLTLP